MDDHAAGLGNRASPLWRRVTRPWLYRVNRAMDSESVQPMSGAGGIDATMERASVALESTDYFECEKLCERALRTARTMRDFERMARICLPLQESRRLKRQLACDAGPRSLIVRGSDVPKVVEPGLYLVQPPMIGAEARSLRELADRKRVPVMVICREPLTRTGQWPIVAVGPRIFRAKVQPPVPLERVEEKVTKDSWDQVPGVAWFEGVAEALGDAGFALLPDVEHPDYRVDDLLDLLDAHPLHEKLHQWLAEACRAAIGSKAPINDRRIGPLEDPFSF